MQNTPRLDLLCTQQTVELCGYFEPGADARALQASAPDVASFLNLLIEHRLWRDAALALAHGFHKRTAVWWACLACRAQLLHFARTDIPECDIELLAIDATERWVRDPQERFRIAACNAATVAGNRAPAHWAAMAAFWATGNMTPDAGVVTSPPPFLYSLAVVSSLEFAAARCGERRDEFFGDVLRRGLDLASGGDGS